MTLNLPLMENNILREDLDKVIKHLKKTDPKLTQGENVRKFEEEWSNWLGVKYSVFVNSGSSANMMTLAALRLKFPEGGDIIVPPLTWVSDIAAVLQSGFNPIFVDIDPYHLGMDNNKIIKNLTDKTIAVFFTHVQGFNGLSDELLNKLNEKKILLIEDVCESHGAMHKKKKLGSIGWSSNFSFYYAHHMSTIEGGMVCTNDEELYQTFRMLRSHGLLRESTSDKNKSNYKNKFPDLNPEFIFLFPAYNVRNTELGGILGRSQLKRLDYNNKIRNRNNELFLKNISPEIYRTDFRLEGSSNYAFNLITRKPDMDFTSKLMEKMSNAKVEFRRGSAGGGNQLRQPYLINLFGDIYKNFPNTDHIHFHGFYIGNFPSLEEKTVMKLCELLNS